jgi:hypothetical protein
MADEPQSVRSNQRPIVEKSRDNERTKVNNAHKVGIVGGVVPGPSTP